MASSLNKLLELVQDRSEHGRNLLFRHVSDLFFNGAVAKSASDSAALVEILAILQPKTDLSVRRELAGHLYSMACPPEPLLRLLIDDVDEVSGPLLDYAALPESLMLSIAQDGTAKARQRLARRRDLSPVVQAALASPAPEPGPEPATVKSESLPEIAAVGQARTEARARGLRLADYTRASSDWQWETDRSGKVVYLSEGATAAFGRPGVMLLGQPLDTLFSAVNEDESGPIRSSPRPNKDEAATGNPLARRLSHWSPFDGLQAEIHRRGSAEPAGHPPAPQSWRLSGVPVFDIPSGRFMGFRGTAQTPLPPFAAFPPPPAANDGQAPVPPVIDTTLTDMLQTLSHEIKTPLNAILGFSEMIELGTWGEVNERYLDCVQQIRSAGHQLDDFISDILDGARHGVRDRTPQPRPVSVAHLVRASIEAVLRLAARRQIRVHMTAPALQIIILTDPALAEHCLTKILRCAIAASAAGSKLTVEISAEANGGVAISLPLAADSGAARSFSALRLFRLSQAEDTAKRLGGRIADGGALTLTLPSAVGAAPEGASTPDMPRAASAQSLKF